MAEDLGQDQSTPALDGSIVNEYILNDFKLSMWIPSELAGKVIGKKGTVITNLQRETRAKLINALPRVGDSLWVAVVIIGEIKSIIAAYDAISNLVNDEVDDVVLEFTMNNKKPFFLYGMNKFVVIKRVSADTNVRIFFPEYNHRDFGKYHQTNQTATLEGSFDDVKKALSAFDQEAIIYKEKEEKRLKSKREAEAKVTTIISKSTDDVDKTSPESDARTKAQKKEKDKKKEGEGARESAKPVVSSEPEQPLEKIEQSIDIPSHLVGLLMTKNPRGQRVSVLNQIQMATYTTISKAVQTPPVGSEAVDGPTSSESEQVEIVVAGDTPPPPRRRRALSGDAEEAEEDGATETSVSSSDSNDDDSSSGSDGFEDVEEEEAVEEEKEREGDSEKEDMVEVEQGGGQGEGDEKGESKEGSKVDESEKSDSGEKGKRAAVPTPVRFRVIGHDLENIEVATGALRKIVSGDRIKEVLINLKVECKLLKNPRGTVRERPRGTYVGKNYDEKKAKAGKRAPRGEGGMKVGTASGKWDRADKAESKPRGERTKRKKKPREPREKDSSRPERAKPE